MTNTNRIDWAKQTALITGASRGLGAALAEALAERGVRLALVARHAGPLGAVVERIRRRGGTVHAVVADVADKEATWRIAGEAQGVLGTVDLLVHNASALGPVPLRPLLDTDCEDLDAVLQTNVVGPFRLTKALVGPMVLRERGVVVHISSDAAVEAYPTWGAYGASKAAHDHLMKTLGAELVDTGVKVVSVDPGEMDTQMHAEALPGADRAALTQPDVVARRLIAALEDGSWPNGGRVIASRWEAA